jgi:serine/threonine protein kinase
MTQAGLILGTAAYMSPEQAKGRPADKRSDLWAFGCVVYEMLTGRRPFGGEDIAETLAHILTKEPDWTALPAQLSTAMRRLLRRCLERDRKRRLDSAAAARLEIEEKDETVPPSPMSAPTIPRTHLAWVAAALATLLAGAAVVRWAPWRTVPEPARLAFELQLASPDSASNAASMFAISPDGTQVVTRIRDGDVTRLSVRPLARLESVTLARTEAGDFVFNSCLLLRRADDGVDLIE